MTKNSFERNEEQNWQTFNKFESLNVIVSIKSIIVQRTDPSCKQRNGETNCEERSWGLNLGNTFGHGIYKTKKMLILGSCI